MQLRARISRASWALLRITMVSALATTRVHAQQTVDGVVSTAKQAIAPLRDSTTLHSAGYFAIGFGSGVKDLTPFQGQHWIAFQRFVATGIDLGRPQFMMYLPVGDSLIPVGVAYTQRMANSAALPTDLSGVEAEWHSHVFCRNAGGEGNTLADGVEDCRERAGTPAANQIAMVHTWTIPNPDGPFAHDNPALPFIATGLKPPEHATRDDRSLGVALGESYGAKLVIAHRIEFMARRAGKGQTLDAPRAALRNIVGDLREAERTNDAARQRTLRKKAVDTYALLVAEYKRLATTPALRDRVDIELAQATGAMAHHHM